MKPFRASIAAAAGLMLLFTTGAFAQTPPKVVVKSSVRHLKSGKVVAVKSYTRNAPGMKKVVAVKSSVRHLKSGKVVAVKSYTRKVVKKVKK